MAATQLSCSSLGSSGTGTGCGRGGGSLGVIVGVIPSPYWGTEKAMALELIDNLADELVLVFMLALEKADMLAGLVYYKWADKLTN